jgi:dihydropteroate synthase
MSPEGSGREAPFPGPHPVLELGGTRYDLRDRALVVALLAETGAEMSVPADPGELDTFVSRAEHAVRDGADVVQVGPFNPASVGEPEEAASMSGIVGALGECLQVPVLVSTVRASVAEVALGAGAVVAEDPFGLTDPRFAATVAAAGAAVVATAPAVSQKAATQTGYAGHHALRRVGEALACAAQLARQAGVPAHRIVVHPELRLVSHSGARAVVSGMHKLVSLGFPVAFEVPDVALTRELVDDPDADDTTSAGIAAIGLSLGARVLRARDVTAACRVRDALAAISEAR